MAQTNDGASVSGSARLAYIDYPAEVDDLIAERQPNDVLSFAAAAGYAIVASPRVERAYLFSIPAGSAADAIPIPLPHRQRTNNHSSSGNSRGHDVSSTSISLAMWLSERSSISTPKSLGVAILSSDAVLRIYPYVPVEDDAGTIAPSMNSTTSTPTTNFPCLEIQVDQALSDSISSSDPSSCRALHVSAFECTEESEQRDFGIAAKCKTELIVYGSRGSAAHVVFSDVDSVVFPLSRARGHTQSSHPTEQGSSRFGSLFYSAIRSIGVGLGGRNSDWEFGTGPHEIIDSHPLDDGIIVVRRGGDVERWNTSKLLWTFNALTSVTTPGGSSSSSFSTYSSYRPSNSIVSSAATSDGTLVLLTQSNPQPSTSDQNDVNVLNSNCQLQCYDVRSVDTPPDTYHMSISVDSTTASASANSPFGIVVCSDVVFLVNPDHGRLAWRSVARGIPADGQVIGSLDASPISDMLFLADVSRGLHFSSTSGVAACLHQNGIMLSCFEVPAPISEDMIPVSSSDTISVPHSLSLLWRSFLQYSAGQHGAARASLQGLVNMFVGKGFDTSEALSQLVTLLSRDIVTKDKGAFQLDPRSNGHLHQYSDRKPFLIDSGLVRNSQAHHTFLAMLADTELFTQVRPDAPSIAEDQIWDALDLGARYTVITDNEMLAAAHAVRQVENAESVRDQTGGFNEAAASNILSSNMLTTINPDMSSTSGKVIEIARALRATLICENEDLRDSLNTVNMALERVGQQLRDAELQKAAAQRRGDISTPWSAELSTKPYRLCYEFFLFIPALDVVLSQTLERLSYDHNVPVNDENIDNNSVYLGGARSAVSLSCEAVIAFLESAMDARETGSSIVSKGLVGLTGLRSWLLETTQYISALQSIAKQSMTVGLKSTGRERESIMGLATLVVDKLLASARQGSGGEGDYNHERDRERDQSKTPRSSSRSRSRSSGAIRTRHHQKQLKRRRLESRDVNSEWRRLLKSCMRLLRDHELDDEAFRLAEKYGDYDTMMALQVNSDNFNEFMHKSISMFGQDFARFAFQWLEERGHIELLLRGRSEIGDDGVAKQSYCEREPIKSMLSDYFRASDTDGDVSDSFGSTRGHNLSWMHWLATGDVERGARALEAQMNDCAKPDKPSSGGNTLFLSSITKLAAYCAASLHASENDPNGDNIVDDEENTKRYTIASARISLLYYQKMAFNDDREFLRTGSDIVRGLIDTADPDSQALGSRVSAALDAARLCEVLNDDEGHSQRDYVWRRCIERQASDWLSFAQDAFSWTDVELRGHLGRTALFQAAKETKLSEHQVEEMLARGFLDEGELEQGGALEQVSELLKTTVALANVEEMVY